MMPVLPCKLLFAATLALAPSDRLQMADKMFAKGMYADAAAEYNALKGERTVSSDDVSFRIAECDRMLGREKEALAAYDSLILRDIPASMRAVAMYRLACARNDASLFLKCEQTDPDGRYASFSRLKRALILAKSDAHLVKSQSKGIVILNRKACTPSVALIYPFRHRLIMGKLGFILPPFDLIRHILLYHRHYGIKMSKGNLRIKGVFHMEGKPLHKICVKLIVLQNLVEQRVIRLSLGNVLA